MPRRMRRRQDPGQAAGKWRNPDQLLSAHGLSNPYNKPETSARVVERLWRELDGERLHNPDYFAYDVVFQNMHAYLSVRRHMNGDGGDLPKPSEATKTYLDRQQRSSSGERSPENDADGATWNWLALINDWHILNACGLMRQADDVLRLLSRRLSRPGGSTGAERALYEAEVALLYSELGPKHYGRAMVKYGRVVSWILGRRPAFGSGDEYALLRDRIQTSAVYDVWRTVRSGRTDLGFGERKTTLICFHAARLYSRLLRRHHLHILKASLPKCQPSYETVFKNVLSLLDFVISTGDRQFSGWAWAVMGETLDTCRLVGVQDTGDEMAARMPSVEQCFEEAESHSPEDVHVLTSVGRHLRQRACSVKQFRNAVRLLEKATSLCPSMHVAYHHLGLAYRSLWIMERGYTEAQLYNNEARTNARRGAGRRSRNKAKWRGQPFKGRPFLRPKYPCDYSSLPRHYKRPDFFDGLRTSNPIERKQPTPDCLTKSRQNLELAVERACGTSVRYLTDLARVCVSMADETADRCFRKAAALLADAAAADDDDENCSTDGAYLYEQWGLYKKAADPLNAKELLLKSVKFSVLGRQRSRVAFYELGQLLDGLRATGDQRAICLERAFVHRLVGQYGQARDCIRNGLCPDRGADQLRSVLGLPDNQRLLWELIRCYHEDGEDETAFEYLDIYMEGFPEAPSADEARAAFHIAIRMVPPDSSRAGDFARAFRWVFSAGEVDPEDPDACSDCEASSSVDAAAAAAADDDDDEIGPVDVLLLSDRIDDADDPVVRCIQNGLQATCGLRLFAASESGGDLLLLRDSVLPKAWDSLMSHVDGPRVCLADVDGQATNQCYEQFLQRVRAGCGQRGTCFVAFTRDPTSADGLYLSAEQMDERAILQTVLCALAKAIE